MSPSEPDLPAARLRRFDLTADPNAMFAAWFEAARASGALEPTAMTLATVDADGLPDARIVLLKDHGPRGFTFFTNYRSIKAAELAARAAAALVFWWPTLERQIRVRGSVMAVSAEESASYFASRPRGSQLGAWASAQSQVIADAAYLEAELAAATARFAEVDVPCPPHWGGYCLEPASFELWQGRRNRLHDRFRYRRPGDGERANPAGWVIERLSP